MRLQDTSAAPETDPQSDVLDGLRAAAPPDDDTPDTDVADTLAGLAAPETDLPETDDRDAVLSALAGAQTPERPDETPDSVLADLAASGADVAPQSPESVASVLDTLANTEPESAPDSETSAETVLSDLAARPVEDQPATDDSEDILAGLAEFDADDTKTDPADAILSDLADASRDAPDGDQGVTTGLNAEAADKLSDGDFDLDDLLPEPEEPEPEPAPAPEAAPEPASDDFDLDDLLSEPDVPEAEPAQAPEASTEPALDDFDLDGLQNEPDASKPEPVAATDSAVEPVSDQFDLDDLLSDPDSPDPVPVSGSVVADPSDDFDLDDLLTESDALEPEPAPAQEAATEPASDDFNLDDFDLDDLLSEPEQDTPSASDDLDDLLGDLGAGEPEPVAGQGEAHLSGDAEIAFGTLSAERPGREALKRKRFRLAILGDFSGRAARGVLETGDALANRRAILLDPDTVEDVIEGFATRLVLPIGQDGAGVEIALNGLDDLHPDELYENVEIFAELAGLRARLGSGGTAENAMRDLRAWGEAHGTPVSSPRRTSSGNAVPAGLKLTDFQKLIGDTTAKLTQASPLDDMLARIVGPHVRAVPDADAVAMQSAVDAALSSAMRMILHHPEFQSIESQWRSIDLIARSVETDDTLEVMLYDVSAEEIAADLASAADLGQSGLARMLTGAPLDEETGRGGYSALIGLYTFEETPPHAEILGRIARVAAHVDAPFVSGLSPGFLDIAKEDRHPLVAASWDGLRALPEAGYLGLVSPRFLLRRPYGAKSEPIYAFKFEEFTMAEGLGGMLWANPCVLVAILLARSFRKNGASMGLGSVMSLGGMPYHFVTDRHGDQVALPCTERNLTLEKVEKVMTRGVMPVVSIKGRDEIRLASFQSLAGGDILGPWSGVEPPPPSAPKPQPAAAPEDDLGLDDLLAGFDDSDTSGPDDAAPGDIDADLAALLEDL
ncbi:type VI secretion system contractile sheath large subunit [Sedimentitalea sp. JM2-8]|uniref:Type VI secretion system contractile sheath large subunit n=2 Tax=Sedimentitalea xiamensis TaxID=3050037 RepID=A0ABT7FII6_9RHOB|nr:type VI secretion system contractile sheath large subunit [Sedimentitalea xiamensis]